MSRILIVDDERVNRTALTETFRQLGHQVDNAASGEEAVRALSENRYEAVLLDLKMPGMGGLGVLQAADSLAPETAFVILTAHATAESAIAALRSRAFDYLTKPTTLQTIIETMNRALAEQERQCRQKQAVALLEQALHGLQGAAPTAVDSAETTEPKAAQGESILKLAGLAVDLRSQTVSQNNKIINLTPMEYALLLAFVSQPDTVLSYAELVLSTRGLVLEESEARQLLRTHLFRLSRKLGGPDESPLQNVRGRGYVLYQ